MARHLSALASYTSASLCKFHSLINTAGSEETTEVSTEATMVKNIRLQLLKLEGNFDSTSVRLACARVRTHTHIHTTSRFCHKLSSITHTVKLHRSCPASQHLDQEHAHSCMVRQTFGLTRGLRAAQPPIAYSLSSRTAHAWLPRLLTMSAICSDTCSALKLLGHMQLRWSPLHDVKHGARKATMTINLMLTQNHFSFSESQLPCPQLLRSWY